MCILVLAVEVSGDQLSPINVVGLSVCLLGIIGHIIHKVLVFKSVTGNVHALDFENRKVRERKRNKKSKEANQEPLLEENTKWQPSEDSDFDSNLVLYEVMQRRDGR